MPMLYSEVQGLDCIAENHPTTLLKNQILRITIFFMIYMDAR